MTATQGNYSKWEPSMWYSINLPSAASALWLFSSATGLRTQTVSPLVINTDSTKTQQNYTHAYTYKQCLTWCVMWGGVSDPKLGEDGESMEGWATKYPLLSIKKHLTLTDFSSVMLIIMCVYILWLFWYSIQ